MVAFFLFVFLSEEIWRVRLLGYRDTFIFCLYQGKAITMWNMALNRQNWFTNTT